MNKTSKKIEEKVLNEEEKVMEENQEEVLEEMSEVHKEKLDKLVKETVDKLVGEEKVFTNITKLKCDYTTYKEERTKYKMPVEEKCSKCGKSFEAGEEIYSAYIIDGDVKTSCIICNKCARGLDNE